MVDIVAAPLDQPQSLFPHNDVLWNKQVDQASCTSNGAVTHRHGVGPGSQVLIRHSRWGPLLTPLTVLPLHAGFHRSLRGSACLLAFSLHINPSFDHSTVSAIHARKLILGSDVCTDRLAAA